MFLTETWLDQKGAISLIEACPPPYTFLQKVRCGKKGGGIAAIFMQTMACKEIVFDDFTTFEYLAIEIIESKCPGACTMMVDEQIQSYRISFELTKPNHSNPALLVP